MHVHLNSDGAVRNEKSFTQLLWAWLCNSGKWNGVLREIKKSGSEVDVIILTAHSDKGTPIHCLRHGGYDYFLKPLEDIDILLAAVERALQKRSLETNNRRLLEK